MLGMEIGGTVEVNGSNHEYIWLVANCRQQREKEDGERERMEEERWKKGTHWHVGPIVRQNFVYFFAESSPPPTMSSTIQW